MSLGIAALLCSVIWLASVFRELSERVSFIRSVVLAYCAGYLVAISAGIVRGALDRDPEAMYRLGPAFGATLAVLATGYGAWRIHSRRNLSRTRPIGDGAYRDPAAVPEPAERPRATALPPRAALRVGRFLVAIFFLGWPVAIAMLERERTSACEQYPRVCSNRSIALAIAHSPEVYAPRKLPQATCQSPEDVPHCGRSDPEANAATRILAARGASAGSDVAEVLRELPEEQFLRYCAIRPDCVRRVKSLMDLLEAHRAPRVEDALQRWLRAEYTPQPLRAEAAAQLVRLGYIDVLPDLAEALCPEYAAGDRRMVQALAEHLKPETVRYLDPALFKPQVRECVLEISLRALLAVDSPSAWSTIERLVRKTDYYRASLVYHYLSRYFELAPRRTVEFLMRLATDGPEPLRACYALTQVQERRLGWRAKHLFHDYCGEVPGKPRWHAKVKELGLLAQ
jgi:hypothetical protein